MPRRGSSEPFVPKSGRLIQLGWAFIVTALATAVCSAMYDRFALADLIMVYLLGVVIVSTRSSLYPSVLTAILSALAFEFFFIPPRFTFAIVDAKHLVTFAVMLFVAIVITGLTEQARRQADAAHRAEAEAKTERLRSSLLSAVSHDLRTPLAAITGAASTMLEDEATIDPAVRRDLTQTIFEEAERLHRLLTNLLHMTRLEGPVAIHKDWQPVEEVIGAALTRLEPRLRDRAVHTHLPDNVTFAPFDAVLIEQVLINLLENAIRYTPAASPIDISVVAREEEVTVEIADRGPGVAEDQEEQVFEKFHRGGLVTGDGGVGLGLSICRAIVGAHGGRIGVARRAGGGATFWFSLPTQGKAPYLAEGSLPELESAHGPDS